MSAPEQDGTRRGDQAADAALDEATRALTAIVIYTAVTLAVTFALEHREALAARARAFLARRPAAARRGPADEGLQVAELRAAVCAYDHAGGPR